MKLDNWIRECEKLSGSCSSPELTYLGEEVLVKKTLLMSFAQKSAEMIVNSKSNMLLEEEATLRKELAGSAGSWSAEVFKTSGRPGFEMCPKS